MFSQNRGRQATTIATRRVTGAALCAWVSIAAAVDAPDHCIVGDNAIGCRSERTIAQLTAFRGNADSLRETIDEQVASGACRLFAYGERVYSTEVDGKPNASVRRPGDASSYVMPSSWSRPVSECSDTPTAALLEQKLGIAGVARNDRSAETGAGVFDEPDREPRESAADVPPELVRLMARQGVTKICIVKPVMTDAEIGACRRLSR